MSFSAMVDRTEAGPLIPEDAANEIIKESTEKSYVLSAFKRRQMSRKQQRIPIFDRKPIAYFVNGDTGLKRGIPTHTESGPLSSPTRRPVNRALA